MKNIAFTTLLMASLGAHAATSVVLSGVLGSKALLIVGGTTPKAVAAGESHQGVKVLSVTPEQAVVEVDGGRHTLRLGETPSRLGRVDAPSSGRRIVLTADNGGHFTGAGSINGRAMRFLVDTGATAVAIGAAEAERMGLEFRNNPPVSLRTANGTAQGWRMRLESVRVGDVELRSVDAIVTAEAMPYVLLGNSFLREFHMNRSGDEMVLQRRR